VALSYKLIYEQQPLLVSSVIIDTELDRRITVRSPATAIERRLEPLDVKIDPEPD
jgi:hypothetical protein